MALKKVWKLLVGDQRLAVSKGRHWMWFRENPLETILLPIQYRGFL
jgi:hypothetical protein